MEQPRRTNDPLAMEGKTQEYVSGAVCHEKHLLLPCNKTAHRHYVLCHVYRVLPPQWCCTAQAGED